MDVFGQHWTGHWEKIVKSWEQSVAPEDVVVVAGDLSWAMSYEDAAPDLAAISRLPGRKVLIRGNHDYWHGSLKRTREMLEEGTYFLQNDAVRLGEYTFCGARGWKQRGAEDFDAQDEKIFSRSWGGCVFRLLRVKSSVGSLLAYATTRPSLRATNAANSAIYMPRRG